jgi:hypothetical protein
VPANCRSNATAIDASSIAATPMPVLARTYLAGVTSGSDSSGKPFRNWPRKIAGRIRGPKIRLAATAIPAGG